MQRLKRVFNIDIETCKTCGGEVKIIACIEDSLIMKKILTTWSAKTLPVPPGVYSPFRAPPQASLFG